MRPSHRVGECRPMILLTEATCIYNQEYGIKLSLNLSMYVAFAIMRFPAVLASSLKGSTIKFFWTLLTHIIKDLTIVCSV